MKFFFVSVLISFFAQFSFAQGVSVSGSVGDKNSQAAVPFAQVLLVSLPDSAIKPGQTDLEGRFVFENVTDGRYALKVLNLGYKEYRRMIRVSGQPVQLGRILVEEDAKRLKEVEIVGKAATTVQKGDTSEFNSKAFKTNPDASAEDLVQKLPGVTMQNGKVQAQGEDVKQVLVDGKEFFGDDAAAALKNLPADVIDKIQVFDQQSEQSRFSGMSDGNTTKTINIVTKPEKRNGKFGKVFAGAGTDNRYQAGGNLNILKNNRRISIIGQTNNINQQNFATADLLGVTGGGQGGRGGRGGMGGRPGGGPGGNFGGPGGGGTSDFQVSTRNGISQTHAFGINYSDQWGKKLEVTGSYFLNATDNIASQFVYREFLPSDSGKVYTEDSRSDAMNINHRVNFKLEWKLDSMNSVQWRPRLTLQQNNGNTTLFGQTVQNFAFLSNTVNTLKTDLLGLNFSNDLIYRHRFAKRGRTFSANFSTVSNGNEGNRFLEAENRFFLNGQVQTDLLNQFSDLNTQGPTYGTNLTYTEPITAKSSLSLEYNGSLRLNEADQKTYDFDEATNSYSAFNTGLSNVFSSNYLSQQVGGGYRFNDKKLQFNARVAYQYATLKSDQEFPVRTDDIDKSFRNVLPMGMLRYTFTKDKNVRFFYRTNTNAPSISQLQNVVDNSNPVLLTTGNPNLVQDYRHNFVMRYSAARPEKSRTSFLLLSGEVAQDYLGTSTVINSGKKPLVVDGISMQPGAQLSRPVNLDGYYRYNAFATYALPVSLIKSNLNLNALATFTRQPGLIDSILNYSNTQTYGLGVTLSSNISQNLDFTVSSNPTYNLVKNTQNRNADNNYLNLNSSLRLNWIIYKGLFLQTDVTHQYYSGLSAGIDQNYLLWNAAIGKKLFKKNQGEIKLTGFDLLSQNNSIQRNITANYIEDVETNVLQRYLMLVFTYNIRAFSAAK
jgi:hypothetical protein